MADERPIQHTPKHLEGDVFDPRHPAASSFAPLQPALGVVANDVVERGQNLAGGPKADDAEKEHRNQREKLREQHEASLRASVPPVPAVTVEGDTAKPAEDSKTTATARTRTR